MKYFFVFILLCTCYFMAAQPPKKQHQIHLITDNDAYLLQIRDGYYSSGIFLQYAIATNNKRQQKVINQWSINHQIFTPQSRKYFALQGIDRPFAGFLNAGYSKQTFINKNNAVQWGVAIGTIGPNALAKPVQDLIHNIMNFKPYNGWENQLNNELNITVNINYTGTLVAKNSNQLMAVYPFANAAIGNAFTQANGGAYFCVGRLEKLFNSGILHAYADGNFTNKKHTSEWLFFSKPQFMYQLYNATVQGGLFTNQQTGVTKTLNPYLFQQTWGFMYNTKRVGVQVGVTYQSKETKQQDRPQRFGTLGFAYRW